MARKVGPPHPAVVLDEGKWRVLDQRTGAFVGGPCESQAAAVTRVKATWPEFRFRWDWNAAGEGIATATHQTIELE